VTVQVMPRKHSSAALVDALIEHFAGK